MIPPGGDEYSVTSAMASIAALEARLARLSACVLWMSTPRWMRRTSICMLLADLMAEEGLVSGAGGAV